MIMAFNQPIVTYQEIFMFEKVNEAPDRCISYQTRGIVYFECESITFNGNKNRYHNKNVPRKLNLS